MTGLVTPWRLAGRPTRRSPSSVKATIEGVVFMPSALAMTFGVAAFHDGDAGVGGSEVDPDDFRHVVLVLYVAANRPGPVVTGARLLGIRCSVPRPGPGTVPWS